MTIKNPFFRIQRRNINNNGAPPYWSDNRYARERRSLIQSYKIIEKDLKTIFEFIEPSSTNLTVYSHRLFELLLRCATEVENSCKLILEYNGYPGRSKDWNMNDYRKINKATKLSEYEVKLNIWHPDPEKLKPFRLWGNPIRPSTIRTPLWYKGYNEVKHNRFNSFDKASLENVIDGCAAVFAILYAQFEIYIFNPYNDPGIYDTDDEDFEYAGDSLFSIKPFDNWGSNEVYDFDWSIIKKQKTPFQKYPF